MEETNQKNPNAKNGKESELVGEERDERGRFLRGNQVSVSVGRKEKAETIVLRKLREAMPQGIEAAYHVLVRHLGDTDPKISQGAAKILFSKAPTIPWSEQDTTARAAAVLPLIKIIIQMQAVCASQGQSFNPAEILSALKQYFADKKELPDEMNGEENITVNESTHSGEI